MRVDFSIQTVQAAWVSLSSAERPVLVAHPHPDGDTLGSALAMWNALEKGTVFCVDKPTKHYDFMRGASGVTNDRKVFEDADVICTFDAGDLVFAGIDEDIKKARMRNGVRIVNVDHHATNVRFGDVNVVDVEACSTAEVVYRILEKMERVITKEIATCLLTGILTDTSGFSNAGTTNDSFFLGAMLIRAGAKMQDVQRNLVRNIPIGGLRMWGSAMERLKYDSQNGMATTMVCSRDFEKHRVQDEQAEGISNFLGRCLVAESILVLKEHDGVVRGSLRTSGDRDVSEVAKKMGGGGHRKAAGFVVRGKIQELATGWGVSRV